MISDSDRAFLQPLLDSFLHELLLFGMGKLPNQVLNVDVRSPNFSIEFSKLRMYLDYGIDAFHPAGSQNVLSDRDLLCLNGWYVAEIRIENNKHHISVLRDDLLAFSERRESLQTLISNYAKKQPWLVIE